MSATTQQYGPRFRLLPPLPNNFSCLGYGFSLDSIDFLYTCSVFILGCGFASLAHFLTERRTIICTMGLAGHTIKTSNLCIVFVVKFKMISLVPSQVISVNKTLFSDVCTVSVTGTIFCSFSHFHLPSKRRGFPRKNKLRIECDPVEATKVRDWSRAHYMYVIWICQSKGFSILRNMWHMAPNKA